MPKFNIKHMLKRGIGNRLVGISILSMLLLMVFGMVNDHHAYAFSLGPSNIPAWQWINEQTYDNPTLSGQPYYGQPGSQNVLNCPGTYGPCNDPQELYWLSITGQSGASQTTTTLQTPNYAYGSSPTLNLDYNYNQFFWTGWSTKYPNQPGTPGGYSYAQYPNQPPDSPLKQNGNITGSENRLQSVKVSGIAGYSESGTTSGTQTISPDNNYRYWFASPTIQFSIKLPSLTAANLTYDPATKSYKTTITIDPVHAAINDFNGAYLCVATGANVGGYNFGPGKCNYVDQNFTVQINVNNPSDVHAPQITANPSCSSGLVTGSATDADYSGHALDVAYSIDGVHNGSTKTNNAGAYSLDLSTYDQLVGHSVTVTVDDYNAAGDSGVPPAFAFSPASKTVTYPPCFKLGCGGLTLNVPGDINGTEDGPIPGENFSLTATVTFTAENNASGSPSAIRGTLEIYVDTGSAGGPFDTNNPAVVNNASTATATFNAPTTGVFSDGYSFTDANDASVKVVCPDSLIVGEHPFFSVQYGSVLTGSGGFGASCAGTNTNAGILAFNNGPDGGGFDNEGSGDNLAAFSPNVINGFDSSNGLGGFVSNPPDGLTFANDKQSAGTFDPNFGGGFGSSGVGSCAPDYYTFAKNLFNAPATPVNNFVLDNNMATSYPNTCDAIGNTTYCYISPTGNSINLSSGVGNLTGNLVVIVSGNVVVSSNILLDDGSINPWAGVSNIPSFYLIAQGNIYVSDVGHNIGEIDGIYIAQPNGGSGGNFYTCTNGSSNFSGKLYSSCNNQLTIDGAVVANQARLNRTAICICAGPQAELFNYPPTVWMLNPLANNGSLPASPSYQSITALPPVL